MRVLVHSLVPETVNHIGLGRCVLCGGNIIGKPTVEHVDGHRLEFDGSECKVIFDRLTAVYGTSFGLSFKDE